MAAGKGIAGSGPQRSFGRFDPGIADPWTIYTGSQLDHVVDQKAEHTVDDDPIAHLAVNPPEEHDAQYAGANGRQMGNDEHDRCQNTACGISDALKKE